MFYSRRPPLHLPINIITLTCLNNKLLDDLIMKTIITSSCVLDIRIRIRGYLQLKMIRIREYKKNIRKQIYNK